MKAIIVNGCKDCPYLRNGGFACGWVCSIFTGIYGKSGMDNPPETPHPNCKLNDLPSDQAIREYAEYNTGTLETEAAFIVGANYILNEIVK